MKKKETAKLLLKNGQIYTIDLEGKKTEYQAMAVAGEKILSLGTDEEIKRFQDSNTEVIDLKGKTVLPGLADSHLHASMTTEFLFDISLHGVEFDPEKSREDYIKEYQGRLREYARQHPENRIFRGVGWNPVLFMAFSEGQPEAGDIDKVIKDIPVILRSFDHHYLWVNSKALELAGITSETPSPRNGVVERDENGDPTGLFQETTAIDLLLRNLPGADYTVEEYKAGILHYQREFGNKYGNTLIFDAYCSENARQAYIELEEEGKLHLRVRTSFYMDPSLTEDQLDYAIQNRKDYGVGSGFGIQTAKFFIDGSGLSFYLNEPFEPAWLRQLEIEEGYRGYPQWTQEELNQAFLKLDSAGIQIHLHCMMDGAVRMAADAFEYAAQFNDIAKNRHTVTHFMLAAEEDLKRLGQMGVIAAIQPMWAVADSLSEENGILMLGEERIHRTYPFGTIKKAGCRITCGTDFPVTIPPSPFIGMQTGITRTVTVAHPEYEKYKGVVLGDGENLTLEDMIEGYSISSAYQCFLESVTGSLEIGKSADFVILDRSLTETPVKEIGNIRAEKTFFKGQEVYSIEEDKRG